MTSLLEARGVTKTFGGGLFERERTTALEDFSFSISGEAPSITAVVGESGSGKTTLARLLLGLTPPTTGDVLYQGKDLRAMSRAGWREFRRAVQVIFQDPYEVYNPFYKVDHVLEVPVRKFKLAGSRQEARRVIQDALRAVGLVPGDTLGRYPHQLSGGQRQRVMVARALLLRPRLIIADEPVSMVDASLRATILESLRSLTRDHGVSLVYITHDLTTAYQISDNIIVLYRGSVAEAGDVDRVVHEPVHPYTRLLIGSIPMPDPDHGWTAEQGASAIGRRADLDFSCKFADRCPSAMEACLTARPPLYQTGAHRVAACYLYRDAPTLPGERLTDIFVTPNGTAPPASESTEHAAT
jgi:peptide/nickel transport system ATP-binding protein